MSITTGLFYRFENEIPIESNILQLMSKLKEKNSNKLRHNLNFESY